MAQDIDTTSFSSRRIALNNIAQEISSLMRVVDANAASFANIQSRLAAIGAENTASVQAILAAPSISAAEKAEWQSLVADFNTQEAKAQALANAVAAAI